jgi:hypothetical protein
MDVSRNPYTAYAHTISLARLGVGAALALI